MKFSTLFSTIILVLCAFGNVNSAQVSIEFRQNDEYFVQCGNNSKSFYNINDFSNGLNSITGEYFGSTSVTKNDDIITFNGVHSGNNNQSILLLKGFSNAEPRIIINVGNSPLVFRKFIAEHINAIEINSDLFGNTIPTEGWTPVKIAINTPDSNISGSVVQVVSSGVIVQYNSNLADFESINNDDEYEAQEDDVVQSTKLSKENNYSKYLKCWWRIALVVSCFKLWCILFRCAFVLFVIFLLPYCTIK